MNDSEPVNPETGDEHRAGSEDSRDIEEVRRRLEELLPAYGIGALDPDEAAFVQAHLAGYADAVSEAAAYAALSRALLHSAAPRQPSPQLEAGLRRALRADSAPSARSAAPGRRAPRFGGFWPRLAVAAAFVLLLALNVVLASRVRDLREENRFLEAQLSSQQEALALVMANGMQVTTLPAAQEGSGALATVRWSPGGSTAVVQAEGLPALEPGMAYQLWLIRDGVRTSGGLFTVDAAGSGTLVVRAPDALNTFDAMGITPEPAAGSPGPTSPPVVVGNLEAG